MINTADFHTVKDLKFDSRKLKGALADLLKMKKYDNADGVTNFGAICLNQIPGDPSSTKGNNARGIYWTKPDHTGNESSRDKMINESAYTEFVKDFEKTYFKKVYNESSVVFTFSIPSAVKISSNEYKTPFILNGVSLLAEFFKLRKLLFVFLPLFRRLQKLPV